MGRSRIIALISISLIGFSLAACANQPSENQDATAPKGDELTGRETTAPTEERAVFTGVVTEVDREPGGEAGTVRSMLVEEPSGRGCDESPADPGCEKIHFRITDQTRVFQREGRREVPASAGNLKRGQRVRADYTGYPVAESYPAQTTARTVVILGPDRSSSASGVFFPRQRSGAGMAMAETRGELILDDDGCLRVRNAADRLDHVPVWPAGFRVDREDREISILNGKGRIVARVGEEVYMGGGEVGRTLAGIRAVDEQTKRELRERCPGTYWLVGTGVTMP